MDEYIIGCDPIKETVSQSQGVYTVKTSLGWATVPVIEGEEVVETKERMQKELDKLNIPITVVW